jgi:hypothetical protein
MLLVSLIIVYLVRRYWPYLGVNYWSSTICGMHGIFQIFIETLMHYLLSWDLGEFCGLFSNNWYCNQSKWNILLFSTICNQYVQWYWWHNTLHLHICLELLRCLLKRPLSWYVWVKTNIVKIRILFIFSTDIYLAWTPAMVCSYQNNQKHRNLVHQKKILSAHTKYCILIKLES